MKTVYHAYQFNLRKPEEREAWATLNSFLTARGTRCMHSHGGAMHYRPELDGITLTLETEHLFDNQWNTAPVQGSKLGLRVFDWAQDFEPNRKAYLAQGHYLDETDEMLEARRDRVGCGYCGRQEDAQRGSIFCGHCLGSAHLRASELHLTRMAYISDSHKPRAPLTEAETAHLLPLYKDAQLHGITERDKTRHAAERARVESKYKKALHTAEAEHKGFTWLLDHGINPGLCIYYTHTDRFSFGWQKPLDADVASGLLGIISEFPGAYDIHCADGRTLSGD